MKIESDRVRVLSVLGIVANLLAVPLTANGATFNVGTGAELSSALASAASNVEDDTIVLAAGTYAISATLLYNSSEARALALNGAGMGVTVLDGGSVRQIMSLVATAAGASIAVSNMTFQNGSTSGSGGALAAETTSGTLTIDRCEITDSKATGGASVGGAANLFSDTGTILVTGSFFRRNSSAGNVGGLYAGTTTGAIQFVDSTFEDNSVVNSGGSIYFGDGGGAMAYNDGAGAQILVQGCTFRNNTAAGGDNPDGGGLMTYQLGSGVLATLENNLFTGNQAGLGGGGCIIRMNVSGTVEFHGNQFQGNSTTLGTGGGALIYVNNATVRHTGNSYSSNQAGTDGAGLWLEQFQGLAEVKSNTFRGNMAGNNGGGAGIAVETATVTWTRNLVSGNSATGVGGGLSYATNSGSLQASNNTYYGNSASGDGGGLYLYFDQTTAQFDIANDILWNDSPNELAYSSGTGSGSVSLRYCDASGSSEETWFGTGCLSADPLFADPGNGDLRLTWASFPTTDTTKSPAIDTGDPISSLDPDGTRADMGAIPFNQNPSSTPTPSPTPPSQATSTPTWTNTPPPTATPTPRSCAICVDTDYDGVPDCWDLCPDTGSRRYVNTNGCTGSGVASHWERWGLLLFLLLVFAAHVRKRKQMSKKPRHQTP